MVIKHMRAEKILYETSFKQKSSFTKIPATNEKKSSGRVDINHLLARVRKEKTKENKLSFIFFSLVAFLILIVGIILTF